MRKEVFSDSSTASSSTSCFSTSTTTTSSSTSSTTSAPAASSSLLCSTSSRKPSSSDDLSGLTSLVVFPLLLFPDLVDDCILHPQKLDIVPSDVDFWQTEKLVARRSRVDHVVQRQ